MDENPEFTLDLLAGAEGFGSGEHPTTHLALQAMYALASMRGFGKVLDMGCGAGLLAMTAAHLWPQAQVLAADIEASAVAMTQQNIAHNDLAPRIVVLRSDGYRHPQIQAAAPFDLILCNITADPIVRMASGLGKMLAADGVLMLSGVLRWRSPEILALHAQLGLVPLLPTLCMDGWDAHVLARPDAA